MSDSKVYMFPEQGTDTALLASTLASRNNCDPMMAAMMGGGGMGMNNMWNNPIWAIVFLAALQNGGLFGGFGNRGAGSPAIQGIEIQDQLSAIREQLNTNQNTTLLMDAIKGNGVAVGELATSLNCDVNAIQTAITSVQQAICALGGKNDMNAMQVINAINSGDSSLANQLSSCCCTLRDSITRQGYENQLAISNQTNSLQNSLCGLGQNITKQGFDNQLATVNQTNALQGAINFVNSSVERGFATTAYETAAQTCELKNALAEQTRIITDKFCQQEMREMAREIQQLRDERNGYQLSALTQQQTQNLVSQLRPCPVPAYITCNPFGCQNESQVVYSCS